MKVAGHLCFTRVFAYRARASGAVFFSLSKRIIISVLIEVSASSLPIDTVASTFQACSFSFSFLSCSF
jgi:hypothetical protein